MSLDDLAINIREINRANGWNVLTDEDWKLDYKVPAIIALIHSEASESLEAFRRDDKENFVEEMADIVIRVLDCVGGFTNEFEAAVAKKMERNRERGHRHGGKKV